MPIFPRKPTAVLASATSITPGDQAAIQRVHAARRGWQLTAEQLYHRLAELHYPANYMGAALARFRYPVGIIPENDLAGDPQVPAAKDQDELYRVAQDAMFALEGPLGGIEELARLYGMNMTMTGEGWLTGVDVSRDETEWEFLSVRELVPTEAGVWQRNSTGAPNNSPLDNEFKPSYTKRFWRADPFATQVADAAMSALVADCQQLVALNESITNRIVTRLSQAGILYLHSKVQVPGAVEAPNGDGSPTSDPFYTKLLNTLESAMLDRNKGSGSIPIIIRADLPPDDAMKFLTMDRTIDRVEMELRAELRNNIATGMDLPAETQQGLGDATHFQAWSIGDSTYQSHLLPEAMRWADGITRVYLWPFLRAWAKDQSRDLPESVLRRYVVVADGSDVVTRPNQAEDRRQLHDRQVISDRALREGAGVEDSEAPSDEEYVRQLGRKAGNEYLGTWGLEVHDKIDWEKASQVGKSVGAPGAGGTPASRRPADSSDPTGAPGIKDGKKNAADVTSDLFAAYAHGHVANAMKSVGARVRGRCEPHPDVFASIRPLSNERVLAGIERDELEQVGVTKADLATFYTSALIPLTEVLAPIGGPSTGYFVAELIEFLADRPTDPPSPDALKALALRVLSGTGS